MEKKTKIIIVVIIFLVVASILLYSRFIGTSGIVVKEYKVVNQKIANNFHGLKVVHITDIHYGRIIDDSRLLSLVDKINALKPDVVVLTGDLIDRHTILTSESQQALSDGLAKIKVTMGKYAINGNHDVKFPEWDNIIQKGQFINLNDNYELLYKENNNPLLIAGFSSNIESPLKAEVKMQKVTDFLKDKETVKPKYRILLMHEPDFIDQIKKSDFDLVLAGHSHNGQVRLPIIGPLMLPPKAKLYYSPYYKLDNTELFISSGVGTSVLNFRLFNRPSINLYRLTNR